jgi:hypothetical protein
MSDDKEPPTNKDEQVEQDERPDNASGLTINPEEVAQEIREHRETIRQLEAERESATRQAAHTSQQLESLKRLVNSMTDEIRQVRQQRDTMEENILDTVSPQDSASQTQGDQAGAQQAVALGAIQSIKDLFPEDQALQQALTAAAERVTQQDEPEENVKVELHTPEQGPFTQRLNNRQRQLAPVRTTLDFGQASTDGDISLNPRGYVTRRNEPEKPAQSGPAALTRSNAIREEPVFKVPYPPSPSPGGIRKIKRTPPRERQDEDEEEDIGNDHFYSVLPKTVLRHVTLPQYPSKPREPFHVFKQDLAEFCKINGLTSEKQKLAMLWLCLNGTPKKWASDRDPQRQWSFDELALPHGQGIRRRNGILTLAKIAEPEMRADESINNFARRVLFAAARIYSDQDSVTTKIKEEWMKGVLIRGVLPELRERCPMAVMQPTFESVKEIYRAAEVNTMIGQGRAPKRTIGTRDPTNDPKSRSTSPRRVTWDASVRSIQAGTPDQQGLEEFRTLMRSDQYDMMNVFGQQNQVVMDRLDNIEKYIRPQRNHGEYMVNEIRTEGEQPQNGRCYFCGANTHRWRNCFQRKKRFGPDPKEASQVTYLPPYDLPFAPPSVRERIAQRGMEGTDPISNRYVANRTKGNVLEELEARLGGINSMEDVQRINAGGYLPELQCNALHQLDSDSEEEYEEEDNYHTGYLRCNFIQLNTPSDQPENNDEFDSEEEVQDSVILEGTDTDPIHESGTIDLSAIGIAPDPNQPNGMDLSQEPEEEEEPEQDEREPETWRPAAPEALLDFPMTLEDNRPLPTPPPGYYDRPGPTPEEIRRGISTVLGFMRRAGTTEYVVPLPGDLLCQVRLMPRADRLEWIQRETARFARTRNPFARTPIFPPPRRPGSPPNTGRNRSTGIPPWRRGNRNRNPIPRGQGRRGRITLIHPQPIKDVQR